MNKKPRDQDVFLALGCNICIAILAVLSFGVFNLLGSSNTFLKSVGITEIPVLILAFAYINYTVFLKNSEDDTFLLYTKRIQSFYDNGRGVFDHTIQGSVDTIHRFQELKNNLNKMLVSDFKSDMDYGNITTLLEDAQDSLLANLELMIKSFSIFNNKEYERFQGEYNRGGNFGGLSESLLLEKNKQFQEELDYIRGLYNKNEELLLELNKLLVEITRIKEQSDNENLSDVRDLVTSIRQLKAPLVSNEMNDLKNKYH